MRVIAEEMEMDMETIEVAKDVIATMRLIDDYDLAEIEDMKAIKQMKLEVEDEEEQKMINYYMARL